MKLKLTLLVAASLLSLPAISDEADKSDLLLKPIGYMTYPMWVDGCILDLNVSLGLGISKKVGSVIKTKHGAWKCVRIVADQKSGSLGSAWAPLDK